MKKEKEKENSNNRVIATNKKARFDYEIIDTFEAGIVLTGTEVKSIREGNVNMTDCYAKFLQNELYAVNLHISHYKQGNINNHDVTRSRKLLLHKRELRKLFSKITEKGFTLVPLKLYLKNGLVKIEIALCKGKKEYEKKESDKRRTENIKVKRIMKQHQSK